MTQRQALRVAAKAFFNHCKQCEECGVRAGGVLNPPPDGRGRCKVGKKLHMKWLEIFAIREIS